MLRLSRRSGLLLVILGLNGACTTHDELVYKRYSRGEFPFPATFEIGMEFPGLRQPATEEDVEKHRAIFSFEGLGARRLWLLPETPNFACWYANNPHGRRHYGYVFQAEELLINGEWKRYYGFFSESGAAVVRAEEIDLSYPEPDHEMIHWVEHPGGVDISIDDPDSRRVGEKVIPVPCRLDQPIMTTSSIRNRRGKIIRPPADLHRRLPGGGHSFRRGVRVHLEWAPFAPKNPSPTYPRHDSYVEVPSTYQTHEADPARAFGPPLKTGERVGTWSVDLHELFEIKREGFYAFWIELDAAALNLGIGEDSGVNQFIGGFTVGERPRPWTLEELNAEIGVLGGAEVEARLLRGITTALSIPPADKPGAKDMPKDFPEFRSYKDADGSLSPWASDFTRLHSANGENLRTLSEYSASSRRVEFERRMLEEKEDSARKMLFAAEAAVNGSLEAALEILQAMKSVKYKTANNVVSALSFMMHRTEEAPAPWVVQMVMASISDDRHVTDLQENNWSFDSLMMISSLAAEQASLPYALGSSKCLEAVPLLLGRMESSEANRSYVGALELMGDERAIRPMLAFFKESVKDRQTKERYCGSDRLHGLISAMATFKVKEAVPLLLANLDHVESIEALEFIGDPSVVPALRKLVEGKGGVEGVDWGNENRLAAARLALIMLEEEDPIPPLCEELRDTRLDMYQRRGLQTFVWVGGENGSRLSGLYGRSPEAWRTESCTRGSWGFRSHGR